MYQRPSRDTLLSQGDIFKVRIAFPYTSNLEEDYLIIRNGQDVPHSKATDAWLGEHPNEFLVAPSFATNYGIVLSNSCDVESEDKNPLEFVTIGAVLPITSLPDQGKHGDLRRNRMVRFFHLPADNEAGFPESYVHFGLLALVRQEAMIAAKRLRVLTLDHPFREDLGHRFGEIFSRIARP
jgi:hypothetical protein